MKSELWSRGVPTPLGELTLVASPLGLRAVLWENEPESRIALRTAVTGAGHPVLAEAARQLDEYFRGERRTFDLPLDVVGTAFQLAAWAALREIPYGETRTYGEQAARLGDKRRARAVGMANHRNPVSIIVPCHRVIGSDGSLTGFAAGLEVKRFLLDHERRHGARREGRPRAVTRPGALCAVGESQSGTLN